jgi:hypothetical protein
VPQYFLDKPVYNLDSQHPDIKFSMTKILLFAFLLLTLRNAVGQAPPSESQRNDALESLNNLRRSVDSSLNPKTLDGILSRKFPESSNIDGRWVYYREKANIQKLEKPEISRVIPEYNFYKINLTNYLGYHINSSSNLILFDSVKSRVIQAVPMWYGDISGDLLSLFIGKKFSDSTSLLKFTTELQSLMNAGSTGGFEHTKYNDDKVTFDLTYQGANRKEVWRHIEIVIVDNTIKGFRSTNPQMKTSVTIQ